MLDRVAGPFMCEVYAMLGSVFGCTSIWTMVMIANDRYNVIVKVWASLDEYISLIDTFIFYLTFYFFMQPSFQNSSFLSLVLSHRFQIALKKVVLIIKKLITIYYCPNFEILPFLFTLEWKVKSRRMITSRLEIFIN